MSTSATTEMSILGRLRQAWSSSGSPFTKKKQNSSSTGNASKENTTPTPPPQPQSAAAPETPATPYFAMKLAEGQYHSKEDYAKMYADAKANGTFQQKTTVFVRPTRQRATPTTTTTTTPAAASDASTPALAAIATPAPAISPAPVVRPSASKRDLNRQAKLAKKVSNLEVKLAAARKQLAEVIGDDVPPVPTVPATLPPTPNTLRKRKASTPLIEDKHTQTDPDYESDCPSEPARKKTRSVFVKRSARLSEKRASADKDTALTVVPDGASVPPIPSIPAGIEGKRAELWKRHSFRGLRRLPSLKSCKTFMSIKKFFESQKQRSYVVVDDEPTNETTDGENDTTNDTD